MHSNWIESLESRQFLSAAPMAGAQVRAGTPASGDLVQQRDQARVKDGSCQTATTTATPSATTNKTQQRDRDRLKDGSCQTTSTAATVATASAKTQQRDRLRDGSCQA